MFTGDLRRAFELRALDCPKGIQTTLTVTNACDAYDRGDLVGRLMLADSVEKLARRFDCSLSWKTSLDGGFVMMGHQGGVQNQLFYSFDLDDYVPRTHFLRGIDRYFDHHRRSSLQASNGR